MLAAASAGPDATPTLATLQQALIVHAEDQGRLVSRNPKLLKATFDILKAMADGRPIAATAAIAGGASAAAKASSAAVAVKDAAKYTSFTLSTFKATTDLVNVAKLSGPLAIVTYIGASSVQKTALLVSLAGGDSERAACIGAILELAASTTTSALLASTGVGAWLAFASLSASAWNAHLACGGANPFD